MTVTSAPKKFTRSAAEQCVQLCSSALLVLFSLTIVRLFFGVLLQLILPLVSACTLCCKACRPLIYLPLLPTAEMLQDCVVRGYRERLALERQERLIREFEEEEQLAAERRKRARLVKKQRRREEKLDKQGKIKAGEGAQRQQLDATGADDRRLEAEAQQKSLRTAERRRRKKKRSRKKKKKSSNVKQIGEEHKEASICEDLELQQCRSIAPSVHCGSRTRPCHYTVPSAYPGHHTAPSGPVPRVQPCRRSVSGLQACHRSVQPCHLAVPRVKPYQHTVPFIEFCHPTAPRIQPCHSDVAEQYPCHSTSTMASFRCVGNECALSSNFGRSDLTFGSERAHEVEQALTKMIDYLLA